MPGHRRISMDLFNRYATDPRHAWKIAALCWLDLDLFRYGKLRAQRQYERDWKKSRTAVRNLIAEFEAHQRDLGLSKPSAHGSEYHPKNNESAGNPDGYGGPENHRKNRVGKDRPEAGGVPPKDQHQDQESSMESGPLGDTENRAKNHPSAANVPPEDHILEPEQEQGEECNSPPLKPSAVLKIEKTDHYRKVAYQNVRAVLDAAPPEEAGKRAERAHRLEVIADGFLACRQIPSVAELNEWFRGTRKILTGYFQEAWSIAFAEMEKSFPPVPKAINAAGFKLAREARERVRRPA